MLQAAATYCAKTAPVLRRLTPAPGIARGATWPQRAGAVHASVLLGLVRGYGKLAVIDCCRRASLEVLRGRGQQGLSTHPFYWGSFVATGNWR